MTAPGTAALELWTPRGSAAGVAVLVARGPQRLAAVAGLLRRRGRSDVFVPDVLPRLVDLIVDGEVVDEALVFDRPDAAVLEIHVHGSPALVERLERSGRLVRADESCLAGPERLLRDAIEPAQLAVALEQQRLRGGRSFADALRDGGEELDAVRRRSVLACAIAVPTVVALVGPRNAGKSTLFNRLVGAARAATGHQAGLTRDPVRETIGLGGYVYEFVDTPGEGGELDASPDHVELDRRARDRGAVVRERADLRVVVLPAVSDPEGAATACRLATELDLTGRSLLVAAKADLLDEPGPGRQRVAGHRPFDLELQALEPGSAPTVRARLGSALAVLRGVPDPAPVTGVGGLAALDRSELAVLDGAG